MRDMDAEAVERVAARRYAEEPIDYSYGFVVSLKTLLLRFLTPNAMNKTIRSLGAGLYASIATMLAAAPAYAQSAADTLPAATSPAVAASPGSNASAGSLTGTVVDAATRTPIASIVVSAEGTAVAAVTDSLGRFRLAGLPAGAYTLKASGAGYAPLLKYNIAISSGAVQELQFELSANEKSLEGVTVRASRRGVAQVATLETPLSIQRLTTEEIRQNPGGNFDISRVVQALPGISGAPANGGGRNDILIRGGGPAENVYYLDGIEIPTINHFSTQGAAGGPVGILNVSFIEDVKVSSSAFDARFDNVLSGVLDFKQKLGNRERIQSNVRLSASELALTFDGPISKKENITFLASARRSYLQLLFQLLDLPIRPNYWDFQYKVTWRANAKNTFTLLGVGAIDQFSFEPPRNPTPENLYILNNLPAINQWNYTVGGTWQRSLKDGFLRVALSRNAFDNLLTKYDDNDEDNPAGRRLRSDSRETENKLRLEVQQTLGRWKVSYGAVGQALQYTTSTFRRDQAELRDMTGNLIQRAKIVDFDTDLDFIRYGAHAQIGSTFFDDRLRLSAGIRADGNTATNAGNDLGEALSPRAAVSFAIAPKWTVNATVGRYARIAPYTVLGFRDSTGVLTNRDARYQIADHYVAGVEYLPAPTTRFTVEGFLKRYDRIPVSVRSGISLANQGTDYGAIGNEDIVSVGKGEAYGFEVFAQQKLTKRFYALLSYTFYYSRFSGLDGVLRPSAWDSRHLVAFTGGYKLGRGWEVGTRYNYQGGAPFTPFDPVASQRQYFTTGAGVLDFSRLNTERLRAFSNLNVRVDKKYSFRRWSFNPFVDFTNVLFQPAPARPDYTFKRNDESTAFLTTDGQPIRTDGSNAIPLILQDETPQIVPTIGFIAEF